MAPLGSAPVREKVAEMERWRRGVSNSKSATLAGTAAGVGRVLGP